jgi:hypothetical protein
VGEVFGSGVEENCVYGVVVVVFDKGGFVN